MLDSTRPYAITLQELAERLGCTASSLRDQERRGQLPKPVLIGARRKYPVHLLEKVYPGLFPKAAG
jgi:DNA-binding transcriptional MerR regulator